MIIQGCTAPIAKGSILSSMGCRRKPNNAIGAGRVGGAWDAEIIEDYPDDKYAPSCLLLGFTENGRPLHIQVSYIDAALVKIITVYEPDELEWIDFSQRKGG